MARRLAALLPRLVALTLIWLLAASSLTFAAAGRRIEQRASRPAPVPAPEPRTLVVPDVRGQAYVFAKGMLEDAGLAWRVEGDVRGYAANLVVAQLPAPGTRVLDEGAPTVVLTLERNPGHAERGLPDDVSPYAGAEALLADGSPAIPPPPAPEPVAKPRPKAKSSAAPAPRSTPALVKRARALERRVKSAPPTDVVVSWWLWEHGRIVEAARAGTPGAVRALRILVRLDTALEARWGSGAQSAALARAALAEVRR